MSERMIFEDEEEFKIAFMFFRDVSFSDSYEIILSDAKKMGLIRHKLSSKKERVMSESYWEEEANSLEIQLSELQEKYEELERQNREMKEFIKFIYEEGHIDDRLNNQCKIFIKDIT